MAERHEDYGFEGLEGRTSNHTYSAELKIQVVKDYLNGIISMPDYRQLQDFSRMQLSDWVRMYDGHSIINAYNEGAKAKTKRRSTTWQKRLEIEDEE